MNRSECPDVSPVTPELWDRIRAGLKKTAGHGLSDCPFSIYNLPPVNQHNFLLTPFAPVWYTIPCVNRRLSLSAAPPVPYKAGRCWESAAPEL